MDTNTNVVRLDDYRKTPRKRTVEENCADIAAWIEEDQMRARTARAEAERLRKFMAEFERRCREGE